MAIIDSNSWLIPVLLFGFPPLNLLYAYTSICYKHIGMKKIISISCSMYYVFNKKKKTRKKGKPVSELIKVVYSKTTLDSNNTINP